MHDKFSAAPQVRRLTAGAALVAVACGLFLANTAFAQGIPTATLSGRVMNDALDLPGVSVTAKSPNLQGGRSTATGASGDYAFPNMPPGEYTVTFTLSGFQTQTKTVKLFSSQVTVLDLNMSIVTVATTLTVSGKSESISQTSTESTTYTGDLLSKLPTARTVTAAVILAPGLNQNGPNGVSVAGAQSTENLYTVNGVVITDNVRSTPNNLFIEDAIQETTTTTSTVSAEYGRFTGGVINTITKSGGNTFSGSFRTTFTDDAWGATSGYRTAAGANPQDGLFVNTVIPTYEATLGGPILKDKAWFFGAGRYFDTSDAIASLTRLTNVGYTSGAKETRYEGKLTLSPFQSHTLTGSYIGVKHDDVNYSFTSIPVSDVASIYNRQLPQEQLAINYNGVITNSFFIEAQYSHRKFTFENSGGAFQDFVKGTVIRDLAQGVSYNAPIFCGVCGPENRDNDNYIIKGTYFLSTPSFGSHNIVAGYDNFGGQRKSNNYQSGSNYVLYTNAASIVQGQNIYPIISEETSTELDFWPVLKLSEGSDLRTQSAYLNDNWRLSNRLSFNVGVRYDKNDATDAAGAVTSKDSTFSPRLAAVWDVNGDGKFRIVGSYAKYVAALQETQAGSGATLAGSPADFYWYYDGPGINTDATKPLLGPNAAMQQVMNWFQAGGCLPDPLAASCKIPQGGAPSIGGVNVQIQNSLASPSTKEWVLGFQGNIGPRGNFRADIVRREYTDYYDLKKDLSTGRVTSPFGAVQDLGLVVNSSDYRREYSGLHTQFSIRLGQSFNLGGNWTWSHLIGNLVGETSGSGPVRGGDHVYPEYFSTAWENPVGDLSSDTRHRVRVYGTWDAPIPARFGALSFGLVQAWDTGTPYGAVGAVASRNYVTNPGYLTPPASVNYYYTARDAFRTDDIYRTDLSMNFSFRIGGTVEVYVAPIVYNVFNSQHVVTVNQAVETRVATGSAYAAFNPFTQTPTQGARNTGANWNYGPLFGQPTGPTSYQTPRYFQVSVGARF